MWRAENCCSRKCVVIKDKLSQISVANCFNAKVGGGENRLFVLAAAWNYASIYCRLNSGEDLCL